VEQTRSARAARSALSISSYNCSRRHNRKWPGRNKSDRPRHSSRRRIRRNPKSHSREPRRPSTHSRRKDCPRQARDRWRDQRPGAIAPSAAIAPMAAPPTAIAPAAAPCGSGRRNLNRTEKHGRGERRCQNLTHVVHRCVSGSTSDRAPRPLVQRRQPLHAPACLCRAPDAQTPPRPRQRGEQPASRSR
jgi:hypothetical protein